ncbi:dethiobiotin synthase [Sphingomonas morindae]|uniref:ATP-dependent dethiobiotin synthetase BioD n=1 Tax=Sphingomonas morindae TaxID=1541170 RepID=A0ABY4X5D7_9SPHN|nr:dethiobiotin synthase [Sphingomonas morindae]USI72148.1 dethiobiotin synthase [Sphingomonas morindae]
MRLIVSGTDTGIGKTVFAAGLAAALGAGYWKPIQSGLEEGADTDAVRRLGVTTTFPEAYRLTAPLSPHRAAELDGVTIDPARLTPPAGADPLVIEGAGGLLVPVTRDLLFADLFARWRLPLVLVARTALGTINHSLLSIEAARSRGITLLGIAFVGEANPDNEATIAAIGRVRRLGRLPWLDPLDGPSLAAAFAAGIDCEAFR